MQECDDEQTKRILLKSDHLFLNVLPANSSGTKIIVVWLPPRTCVKKPTVY